MLDPEPDSDAEDSARLDGVQGQPLPDGERVYLGLSVTMLDQKQARSVPGSGPRTSARIRYLAGDRPCFAKQQADRLE